MSSHLDAQSPSLQSGWLKSYYFIRAAVSVIWVAAAVLLARNASGVAAILLVAYPAWDALANYLDAARSGGIGQNRTQMLNVIVSLATTVAVIVALGQSLHAVLLVFGVWAILSGLLQLATGVRRWASQGAQWAMILSGGQSALAGGYMIYVAGGESPGIADIAPYAAFGAFYFLVSAIWLTVSDALRASSSAAR